jgi:hypothetical protein
MTLFNPGALALVLLLLLLFPNIMHSQRNSQHSHKT